MTRNVWRRSGVAAAARAGLLLALLSPLGLPLAASAQDGPVLLDEAVAVVAGAEQGWIDTGTATDWSEPNAIPAESEWVAPADEWADPSAVPEGEVATDEWVDPNAAPAVEEAWVDPNAAPADASLEAAPSEVIYESEALRVAAEGAPGQPVVPVDQLPIIDPMSPPPSTGMLAPSVDWSPPSKVFVAETQQPLGGGFLDVWRQWGGHLSWGYPLTPEMQENGVTVQYFSYGRFEYHPNDPNGNAIKFSKLGAATQPFMVRRSAPEPRTVQSAAVGEALAWMPVEPAAVAAGDANVRYVPETGHTVAGDMLAFWSQTGEASYLGNPVSEAFERDGVRYQVFERGRVVQEPGGWPYLLPIGKLVAQRWSIPQAPAAQGDLPTYDEGLWTPPPAQPKLSANGVQPPPNGERSVLISLSQQYAWAYQGDVVMWQGYVSTGRAGFATPAGTFYVLTKYKTQTMEGVLGGEYYNVPNVPDILYFTNQGHAIHGTYWHNNFGTPMSHGCINLPLNVAEWMYDWAPMGMRVTIVP
jgi:lipoprotein-anchoring transpeptidase ErfK/SrfK